MNIPKSYTTDEVAKAARVTRRTVYNWISSGYLEAVKAGPKNWLISERSLRKLLTGRDIQPELPEPGEIVNGKSGARYLPTEKPSHALEQSKPKEQWEQLPLPGTIADPPLGIEVPVTPAKVVVESPKPKIYTSADPSRPAFRKMRRR